MTDMDSRGTSLPPSTVVIIPAYNVASTLPRQLSALDDQTDLDFRVVVSDNRSTDGVRDICASWEPNFQGLAVIDASARQGVAYARNAAIQATDEELILICDGDDRVHSGWVAAMKEGLVEADGVTGPLQLVFPDDPEKKETWNADSLPVSMGYLPYLPGCSLGIRRSVFNTIGLFDADLDLGQEDVDFGWRMTRAGLVLGHTSGALVDYFQRSGLRAYLRQQRRYGRAHVRLYDKHCREEGAPAPASLNTSLRWFWEWGKQMPGTVRRGELARALGAAAFQAARLAESIRRDSPSPL